MYNQLRCLFFVVCIVGGLAAAAQDDTTILYDSGVSIVEPVVDTKVEEGSVFDSLTAADGLPVTIRSADRKAIEQMRKEDDFWYYNTAPKEKKVVLKKKERSTANPFLPYLLWTIVIGGFLAFLVWFLLSSNVQLFRKTPKRVKDEADDVQEPDNIFEINFEERIAAAVGAGNFRLATRLLYLRLLTRLSDKGLIQYRQQQTNFEYVQSLYGTKYYKDFFRLTRHFEYSWYGQLNISEEAFAVIRNDFNQFENTLPA